MPQIGAEAPDERHTHTQRTLAVALTLGLLGASVPAFATSHNDMRWESDEGIAIEQQESNNLPLADPQVNTTILDSYYAVFTFLGVGVNPLQPLGPGTCTQSAGGMLPTCIRGDYVNFKRSTQGELPDMILPGEGAFYAFYGNWKDANEDQILRYRGTDIEYVRTDGANIYSFAEPGSYPTIDSNRRPNSTTPDFRYLEDISVLLGAFQYTSGQGYGLWSWDGSLMRTITLRTVSEPLLAPDPITGDPFTCRTGCLLDIDVYSAVAPGPVSSFYTSVVGPIIDEYLPTVGFSSTTLPPGVVAAANEGIAAVNEALAPAEPVLEAVDDVVGPVVDPHYNAVIAEVNRQLLRINPDYENETRPGSGSSTSEVGIENFTLDWYAWFDARLEYEFGYLAGTRRATMSNVDNTGPAGGPGTVSVSARVGVAKDLNGNHQLNNNKWLSTFETGEFKGTCVPDMKYTLTPVTPWSTHVFGHSDFVIGGDDVTVIEPGSSTPLVGTMSCYTPDATSGDHQANEKWFFPAGAPEMILVVGTKDDPATRLTFAQGPIVVTADLWDRDVYASFI